MWPKRPKTKFPRLTSPYSSYIRGRIVRLLSTEEAAFYASDERIEHQIAFALGATTKRRGPIMTEREVGQAVRDRLDLVRLVAEVERGDDPGSSSTPPPPVPVVDEETHRVQPRRWIGDPLPQT